MTARWRRAGGRRFARVPRPLAGLLVATAIFGIAWALVMPAWDGPDEIQHYSYVETLAQRHGFPGSLGSAPAGIPVQNPGLKGTALSAGRPRSSRGPLAASSGLAAALAAENANGLTVGLARPEQSDLAYRDWLRSGAREPQNNGGAFFVGANYPPAYYVLELPGYLLAGSHANAVDHLYTTRLLSVVWLLLTAVGVWLLAGELTGNDRGSQLLAAGAVSLWPMLTFLSAMVNPDALMIAVWTWAFWIMARIVRRELTAAHGVALLVTVGLAMLTKTTSLALLPGAVFVVLVGLTRRVAGAENRRRTAGITLALVVGVPVLAWLALSEVSDRPILSQAAAVAHGGFGNLHEFLSYLWQYYLPRLPGQVVHRFDIPVVSDYSAYNVLVATSWGAFGWVTLFFPLGVYPWLLGITVAIATAAVSRLVRAGWRVRRSPQFRRVGVPLAVCFGLTTAVLLLGLHVTEFKFRSPTIQGRYLFPLAAFAGLALALAVRWVPTHRRPFVVGLVLAAVVGFQLASLGYVAAHLYA